MSTTDELRRTLDERGVEWTENDGEHVKETSWPYMGELDALFVEYDNGTTRFTCDTWCFTPEQAIAATIENERLAFPEKLDAVAMEREQQSDPMWEQWYKGLRHDKIKTTGDAVEQLMYETIEHGGNMGPNGNTYDGIDEGEALTLRFIDDWIEKFKVLQENEEPAERGTCHYEPDYMGFTWWDENDIEHYEENSASDECSSASCNKCGYTMMVGEEGWFDGWDEITEWTEEDGSKHKGYILRPRFKFCPNCGKVVNA